MSSALPAPSQAPQLPYSRQVSRRRFEDGAPFASRGGLAGGDHERFGVKLARKEQCTSGELLSKSCVFRLADRKSGHAQHREHRRTRTPGDALLGELAAVGDFRPGSLVETHRKCGKPTCHCARPGDPATPAGCSPPQAGNDRPQRLRVRRPANRVGAVRTARTAPRSGRESRNRRRRSGSGR